MRAAQKNGRTLQNSGRLVTPEKQDLDVLCTFCGGKYTAWTLSKTLPVIQPKVPKHRQKNVDNNWEHETFNHVTHTPW